MPHAQPRAPLKNGAAVGRSRLKIATDVAGMLGSSEASSMARMEIDGAQRGDPVELRARWGPMEKMPHRW
jgi:hypothetical protein